VAPFRAIAPTLRTDDELDRALTALAETEGLSRQEVMRRWVDHAHHELRQPLAVIAGVGETLGEYHGRLDEQTQGLLIERLRRQTMLLQRVVDQLEQASRLQSGPLEVTPQQLDLRPLVEQLLGDYGPLLEGISVTYEVPASPPRIATTASDTAHASTAPGVSVWDCPSHVDCPAPTAGTSPSRTPDTWAGHAST